LFNKYFQSKDCSNCTKKKHKTNQDRKDGDTRSFVQTFKRYGSSVNRTVYHKWPSNEIRSFL